MYTHNHITESEFLKDEKNGKERPWKEHKMSTMELAESYARLGMKKSYRVTDCGSFLEFKRSDEGLKLHRAVFCKVRLCPMCAWRRSLKIFGQVSKVMNHVMQNKEYRFLFLTLTCRNVYGEDLADQLDLMFKAYKRLMERKSVKSFVNGWFRALEVTHDTEQFISSKRYKKNPKYYNSRGLKVGDRNPNFDTYHPHFHVVIGVNKSYFTNPKVYLKQEEWTKLWKDSLKVDYVPLVDVRAFRVGSKLAVSKSVAETAKYTVKSNDFIIRDSEGQIDEELTDSAVFVLDSALAHRRLLAFGGEFKDVHKMLNLDDIEDGDLVNTDNEEMREDVKHMIERYRWHVGYSNYVRL